MAQLSRHQRSIVFLGTAHDNGGTSILASNLAKAMRARGHHVEEWYLFGSDGDMPAGTRVFVPAKRSRSPMLLLSLFFRVLAALRQAKPDVLFGLQPYSNLLVGVAGRIAGIRNRIPTYHGPRAFVTPSLMALDDVVYGLGLYTQMIACANNVAVTYHRDDMAVVVNGHDVPQTFSRADARTALGLPADAIILGQIGRLSHQKNQSFSLELIRHMSEAVLVLLGIGPDEALLKSQIDAAGLTERVHIVPAIAHGRIGLFYSAIDLALFPSRYEGLSLAGIEAIHAGVAALCSDIPSFREMFAASPLLTAQLLLPEGDQAAWIVRIRTLLADQTLRKQIGSELARLSPAYGFEVMAEQYLRVIDQWDAPPQRPARAAVQTGL
ncbi:MAG TPA: glycosyltransferase family 4 protein [Xanthobacteraceae bacterium]|nr:glycosyltransferase family 4 protein [Xanthobacteraceae bacterium]